MKYIEALEEYEGKEPSLFLAGGITGCPDWQKDLVYLLRDTNLVLLNPRRTSFPINNPQESKKQILWEYKHLRIADMVSFWFPKETLCPITLYELGKLSTSRKRLIMGVHPEYSRRLDIEIQTNLIRPEIKLVGSLEELAERIKQNLK